MKHSTRSFLLGGMITLTACPSMAVTDRDVVAAAKGALAGYLEQIPVGHESDFGFQNRQELARAKVGHPISILGVRPSVADSVPETGDRDWNRVVPLERWRVPVEIDGKPRVFVTVERNEGVVQAVDFGGSSLAREIGEVDGTRSAASKAILRLEGLRCDVLVLDRTGKGFDQGEYHPLRSARTVFGADSGRQRTRQEMFESIHRRMRQNLTRKP